MTKEYDLVVLGGGTGGYVGAIRAAQLGMKVAIVEKEKLGGTCLHKGCIPSKALLRTAELYRQMKDSQAFGIVTNSMRLQFDQAQNRKNNIIEQLHNGVKALVKKGKIDVYYGFGRILGSSIFSPIPGTISVEYENGEENTMLVPKNVLIATGSAPRGLPNLEVDGIYIMNSDHALQLEQLPSSIVIIGAGIIGIEWASMLTDLGVNVTVIESNDEILFTEDKDIIREVERSLKKRGVNFIKGALIDAQSIKIKENVTLTFEQSGKERSITSDKVLISVGRKPNIDQIGLTNTSIKVQNNSIVTNEMFQTSESHIYAIGDCIGGMQLAHVASAEAIVAVEHMAEQNPSPLNEKNIPTCIYSYPEVGRIGLTEQQAKEQGYNFKVGKFPFQAIGKAQVYGEKDGFCKVIVDSDSNDILGVHMVGPQVTDMISEASLAKFLDATSWEISKTIHPHPSLSEVFVETALSVDGMQIHG